MPIAALLHRRGQCDQCMIRLRLADDLQSDRHGAIVKSGWKSTRRKAQHINEACPAAELIERFSIEQGRVRITFSGRWRADRKRWQHDRPGIPEDAIDEVRGKLRACRDAGCKYCIVDCEPFAP